MPRYAAMPPFPLRQYSENLAHTITEREGMNERCRCSSKLGGHFFFAFPLSDMNLLPMMSTVYNVICDSCIFSTKKHFQFIMTSVRFNCSAESEIFRSLFLPYAVAWRHLA